MSYATVFHGLSTANYADKRIDFDSTKYSVVFNPLLYTILVVA